MSLVLSIVLEVLGFSRKLDVVVTEWIGGAGLKGPFQDLPGYVPWLWTVPLVIGIAYTMLNSRMVWRRVVLWVTTLALTIAWVPVFALAGFHVAITTPLFALAWCGLWSLIYATRHEEPGEVTK